MQLTDDESRMLDGAEGRARQVAMELLVRYGRARAPNGWSTPTTSQAASSAPCPTAAMSSPIRPTWMRSIATLLALAPIGTAHAQTSGPPPSIKPEHSIPGDAGFTNPRAAERGSTYFGPIMSRWGRSVTAQNAWREYPRPQMVRKEWLNLNGHGERRLGAI